MRTADRAPDLRRDRRSGIALLAWLAIVVVAVSWGTIDIAGDPDQTVPAAPFMGRWRPDIGPALLPAAALGVLVVVHGPRLAATLSWLRLLLATTASTVAWTTLLAVSRGWDRLTAPLTTVPEYEPFAAQITDAPGFVRTFIEELPRYPTHVRGHPPGAPFVFWALDRLGLPGAGWAAALVVLAWGGAVAAALVTLRAVTGEGPARRAAPTLVVLPAAIWAGTSFDALIAGTVALGSCLVVVAGVAEAGDERSGPASLPPPLLAMTGGVVLGAAIHLSYGAAPLLLVPMAVLASRRAVSTFAWASLGGAAVVAAFTVAGFWWPAGLAATRLEYLAGVASERSWAYFVLAGNPGALLLATGPAWLVGLASLRREDAVRWAPVLGALVAVLLADLSGLSKAEVERIWLPFVPLLVLASGAVPEALRTRLLAGQAVLALALQAALASPW